MQKIICALAVLFMAGLPIHASAQFTNMGFETGNLSGWATSGSASVVTGFNQGNWLVTPGDTRMARIEPSGSTTRSSTETFLGLSGGALTSLNSSVFNSSTNFAAIKQSVSLSAGQTVTAYWNYVSQDYSPYNDGVFASLVGPSYQETKLLAVTVSAYGTAGTIVTGSYGSTGWHMVTFTAGAAGTYTLGFGAFNSRDQAVNALLFVDNAAGGTTAPGQATVTTTAASSVTGTTAVTGGNVTNNGGATVTARGVVYGTSPLPTLSNSSTSNGNGNGAFTSNLSGLTAGNTYYVRAYATNSAGTSYGNEVSFTTPSCIAASFTTCPSGVSANAASGQCSQTVSYTAAAGGTSPSMSYSFSGATTGSGSGDGSGSTFNVGVTNVTLTTSNACGNATCSFTVTVTDNQAPSITSPADVSVNADNGLCSASGVALGTPTSSDNCGIASVTNDAPATFPVGNTTVTWTATDVNGNTSTSTQTVTVADNQAPTAICQNYTLNLVNGAGTITAANIDNGSSDNCGIASITFSKSSFTCADAGNNTVVMTVTDVHNNVSTCTTTVTVLTQPTASNSVTPANTTYTGGVATNIYLGYGPQSATLSGSATGGSGFTYSWSPATDLSCTNCQNPVFTPSTAATRTYTVTATNSNGCSATSTVTFCVRDIRVPNQNNKVYLCHVPSGNSGNPQTLSVSTNAVASHLTGHSGDRLGACEQSCSQAKGENNNAIVALEDAATDFALYPNPTNGKLYITVPGHVEGGEILVTDVTGRMVKHISFLHDARLELDLGNVAKGVYMVQVINGVDEFRGKVIVQ